MGRQACAGERAAAEQMNAAELAECRCGSGQRDSANGVRLVRLVTAPDQVGDPGEHAPGIGRRALHLCFDDRQAPIPLTLAFFHRIDSVMVQLVALPSWHQHSTVGPILRGYDRDISTRVDRPRRLELHLSVSHAAAIGCGGRDRRRPRPSYARASNRTGSLTEANGEAGWRANLPVWRECQQSNVTSPASPE